jgi:hypothetical protein
METRQVTLSLDAAKEWYNKGGELKEVALRAFSEDELNPSPLVRSWKEAFRGINGFFVMNDASIQRTNATSSSDDHHNVYRTEAQAKSALAFAQLSHIVADANGDWEADWKDMSQNKHSIDCEENELVVYPCVQLTHHLPMKCVKIAEECLRLHPQLWEDYWMIDRTENKTKQS